LIVCNAICIAVDQLVALPASNQLYIILSKTITKDKRAKGLHYISDISDEDYCYYNASEASESEVNEHALDEDIETEVNKQGLDKSDTNIEMEGLPLWKRKKKLSPGEVRKRYIIWHQRFHYMGPKKLRHLHKVTKLKEKICIPTNIPKYEVCKLAKMWNRTSRKLSPWKDTTLVLIYIDAYRPLPKSL
jgi:hypothetical protein